MSQNHNERFMVEEALARCPQPPATTVEIILAPLEMSTSYAKGCAAAPQEIIHASHQLEDYDLDLGFAPCTRYRLETDRSLMGPIMKCNASGQMDEALQLIQDKTVASLKAGHIPCVLGGEHTISYAVLKGYRQFSDKPLTVVQMDAHGDLRASYDGREICHATIFHHISKFYPVHQFGIRVCCEEELEFIAKNPQVKSYTMPKLQQLGKDWARHIIDAIPTESVFLSVDVDGFDPSIMPATGTPVPGGLQWHETLDFYQQLFKAKKVVGADFVELMPQAGQHRASYLTATMIYRFIGYGMQVW